tara:strand:+ start:88 stop:450 length:363 start_codon:yes stop_codon:yes gene_type:complete
MEQDVTRNDDQSEDLSLLKVRGSKGKDEDRDYVKKLANAIIQVFSKHGVARLRCVGAGAVNNATKAALIAKGEAFKRGDNLVSYDKCFTEVPFENSPGKVDIKTGIIKEVKSVEEFCKGD